MQPLKIRRVKVTNVSEPSCAQQLLSMQLFLIPRQPRRQLLHSRAVATAFSFRIPVEEMETCAPMPFQYASHLLCCVHSPSSEETMYRSGAMMDRGRLPQPLQDARISPSMKNLASYAPHLIATGAAVGFVCACLPRREYIRRGQVVVITGGSSGLGLALAHRFGQAGVKLVLAARNEAQLQQAERALLSAGSIADARDILLVACDLSDAKQAAYLIDETLSSFGVPDILINNAGIIEVGPVESQPLEVFERAMAVNFFGALYTIHALLPSLLRRRRGSIVNISSVGGKMAVPHLLPYVASKFALTGLSEGLHSELRHKGIRVTTVCPGLMRTGGEDHAHFRGQARKEAAWFKTAARTPLLAASVAHAAEVVFDAVNRGRTEVAITPQAWLAARFAGLAPETTQWMNAVVNRYILPAPPDRPIFTNP
jgi:NAD(P)-dependent dehydrogenase (short-subunit alcohol dehydrogenase family)